LILSKAISVQFTKEICSYEPTKEDAILAIRSIIHPTDFSDASATERVLRQAPCPPLAVPMAA